MVLFLGIRTRDEVHVYSVTHSNSGDRGVRRRQHRDLVVCSNQPTGAAV
jgi:hypothetical protein